jgi:hypothetical protein
MYVISVKKLMRVTVWILFGVMVMAGISARSEGRQSATMVLPHKFTRMQLELKAGKEDALVAKAHNVPIALSQDLPKTLEGLTPTGWAISDGVRQFTAENLYQQINGRAEFYLAYNMRVMTFASYENKADAGQFIDLSIYDMGNPTNAFGVFSLERSQGQPSLSLGRISYRSGASYFIWKGLYYIRIIASETSDELQPIGMALARKVTDALLDSGELVWGLTALPLADQVPESLQYFRMDAMGLDFMGNTYTSKYRKGNAIVTVFLSQRDDLESAGNTMVQYADYTKRYGKGIGRLKLDGVEFLICDMDGSYDVVFQKGRLVGGVTSVERRNLAIHVATDLWRQL